ncbi:uncharacterized protein LOC128681483 [Plodia interpunctella]|uniref:uncharacterized protein LOC128681483 n=1 Tax=Plodia interpunctella TaxID=58824 RepID=UPI0023684FB2|nr:uncharacterized protein LOC128681483 [Plodia interpunctella]
MAAVLLAVAALVWQASAQIYNGPFLTQPLLQPLTPSSVSQIGPIVSFFSLTDGILPTITEIPSIVPDFNLPLSVLPARSCLLPTTSQIPLDIPDLPQPVTSSIITNPTPVISTTVVDNSVANSLANVLQLLIVSELLESSYAAPPASPFLSNFVPLYDAIGTIGTVVSPLDAIAPTIDVTTVSYSPVVDIPTVVTEVITSTPITPVVNSVIDVPIPTYAPVTEIVTPVTTYTQNVYAPVPEVVAPIPEAIAPVISTVTEVSSSITAPVADLYTSITDTISVTPVPYYAPTYVTEVTETVAPLQVSIAPTAPISYISDYYSGYADVITPVPITVPFAAELILPQSIPAQIVCNFGYSPVNVPVFNMNVEPLPGGYVF